MPGKKGRGSKCSEHRVLKVRNICQSRPSNDTWSCLTQIDSKLRLHTLSDGELTLYQSGPSLAHTSLAARSSPAPADFLLYCLLLCPLVVQAWAGLAPTFSDQSGPREVGRGLLNASSLVPSSTGKPGPCPLTSCPRPARSRLFERGG